MLLVGNHGEHRVPSLINYSHWKRPKVTKYYNWVKCHKRELQGEYRRRWWGADWERKEETEEKKRRHRRPSQWRTHLCTPMGDSCGRSSNQLEAGRVPRWWVRRAEKGTDPPSLVSSVKDKTPRATGSHWHVLTAISKRQEIGGSVATLVY